MPRITKTDLDNYADLVARADALAREARTLRAQADRIAAAAEQDLVASGKDKITRAGWTLLWVMKRKPVAWKNELVDRIGVEAVAEIAEAAPLCRKLAIEPPKG